MLPGFAPTPGAEDAALHSASTSAENSNCRCGKEVINRVPFGCEREICRNRRRSACRRSQWRACVVRTRPLWSCVMHQGRRASCAERGVLGRLMRAISADVVCDIAVERRQRTTQYRGAGVARTGTSGAKAYPSSSSPVGIYPCARVMQRRRRSCAAGEHWECSARRRRVICKRLGTDVTAAMQHDKSQNAAPAVMQQRFLQ